MATNLIYTTWLFIKSLVDSKGTNIHFIETDAYFDVRTQNGQMVYETRLYKLGYEPEGLDVGQNTSDLTEFEANYKPDGNPLEKPVVKAEIDSNVKVDVTSFNVVSNKLRYAQMVANQSLTKDTYTTIYEYNGSGNFFGCYLNVADSDMEIKITVDGEDIVTDFTISDIPIAGPGSSGNGISGSIFIWRAEGDEINFQPPSAIVYATSIKVELKAHHNSSSKRKMTFGYVVLTKEN